MSGVVSTIIDFMERGLLPDRFVRSGIRQLVRSRARELHPNDCESAQQKLAQFIDAMYCAEIAPKPEAANQQHYEVPAAFYELVLGHYRKYSCGLWDGVIPSLDHAEMRSLTVTCEHAALADGQNILELGCGWGSLSLWMAEHYPNSHITAVSNSASQRAYIERLVEERLLNNVQVITADMNDFSTDRRFDRVVSVEMFEHMRNWPQIFRKVSDWLANDGKFFMHVFCHRNVPYEFVDKGASDWMSRYFFTGGMMPSDDLPLYFQEFLQLEQRWRWGGEHYRKTAEAWVANMDRNREQICLLFDRVYGKEQSAVWFMRWRIFFLACAELFGYDKGQHWWVSHYRFGKSG